MRLREMDIRPSTREEKDACQTVTGMRRRINDYQHFDALTRAVFNASYHQGLSGEDTMTMLAFEALCRLEHLTDLQLRQAELSPNLYLPQEQP